MARLFANSRVGNGDGDVVLLVAGLTAGTASVAVGEGIATALETTIVVVEKLVQVPSHYPTASWKARNCIGEELTLQRTRG